MKIKFGVLGILIFFSTSCGNYDMGYEDGCDGEEMKKWVIFGRSQYSEGYEEGWSDPRCD